MKIFVDSADILQIETWSEQGIVDGATTNPSIMFKDGITDLQGAVLEISKRSSESGP